jgi:hypothetical protein
VADLKVANGVSTDNPLGLTLGGSGVNTLGGLTVNGDATTTGSATIAGPVLVSKASDHLTQTILNTQLSGYTSLYLESKSGASAREIGQIFCGGAEGLNLRTNTAHPIRFTTYNDAGTQLIPITPSMQILANATRDVEILAPLKVKGPTTTIDNNLTVSGNLFIGATNVSTALGEKVTTTALNLKDPLASPSFTGDVLIMETAVPGQIKHAFRQSGLSEIRTGLEVSGDISSNGTVWSQNEAC